MRLIDADALEKRAYDDLHYRAVIEDWEFDVITNYLDAAPAIEAEPVKHGRWEFKHPNGWACSECGEWGLMIDNRGICKSDYCPNCGAKMDGKEKHT